MYIDYLTYLVDMEERVSGTDSHSFHNGPSAADVDLALVNIGDGKE